MRNLRLNAPASVVADYFRLFVNRRAYTLQSNRPHPESARHYYYRPKDNKTGQGLSLTPDTIRRHLEGEITIGLYSINPATQCSKWVAVDADYQDSLTDLLKLSFYLKHDALKPGRYGNAMRGPLGIHRGAAQRFWFAGADEDLEKQMRYLNSLPKMTRDQLARLIAGKAIPPHLLSPEPKAEPAIRRHVCGPEFRILDHINTKLRTVGHNNIT